MDAQQGIKQIFFEFPLGIPASLNDEGRKGNLPQFESETSQTSHDTDDPCARPIIATHSS
jgi:hypothetical protein